jgi:hypothetical protein
LRSKAKDSPHRLTQLVVPRKALMLSVLLEAGSIVNRQEELELATPERRLMMAEAVTAAVENFCASRGQASLAGAPEGSHTRGGRNRPRIFASGAGGPVAHRFLGDYRQHPANF